MRWQFWVGVTLLGALGTSGLIASIVAAWLAAGWIGIAVSGGMVLVAALGTVLIIWGGR